ncbi:MAG: lasso peptide biosynthesis B2 protein [Novosphingobium pentaromativorans]|uniref:Lasso peptide biosynthesis B2 protein n=1 Tax=Novosphingobium pentaromativorans TaxID=205844 RepID=A0A2W5Q772_9SPHN|nr:MAG: lasso peptide biosynthesis B2 protein [Novosphingobium pentaromativorans]
MPTSLRGGLSFCTLGDRIVFLDLPADRYFGLSHDAEDVFRRALAGLPIPGAERDLLVKARIIVPGDAPLCLAPCAAETAHRSAFDQTRCPSRRRDVAALAWHLLRARASLRLRGLPATAASLVRRKAATTRDREACSESTRHALAAVACAQEACARMFGSHDLCLPYAIAAACRLHATGIPADVVIAVGMPPFRAHAWVQWQGVLVNERLEIAAHYTPIAVL